MQIMIFSLGWQPWFVCPADRTIMWVLKYPPKHIDQSQEFLVPLRNVFHMSSISVFEQGFCKNLRIEIHQCSVPVAMFTYGSGHGTVAVLLPGFAIK